VRATGITIVPSLPSWATARAPLGGELSCTELTLAQATFSPRDGIDAATESQAMLPDIVRIPMALVPGGKPVVELMFPKAGDPLVDIIERSGNSVRVVVYPPTLDPDDSSLIVGWIPASILRPHSHGFGGSWTTGGEGGFANGRPRAKRSVTCTHEVPLVVELGTEQHLVGAITAKTTIGVLDDAGPLVEVEVRNAGIELAPGARLLAKLTALADCT
jgi:hypothetical protein